MAEFNIRSDAVDVTKIMEQIRERIREKRGTDYTEQQIRELANVKLEGFFDPEQVRSDLVEHFQRLTDSAQTQRAAQNATAAPPEVFDFNQDTIYVSSRGPMGKLIRLIRKILNPFLKLFFNPNPMIFALQRQAEINAWTVQVLQSQTELVERVGKKFLALEELDKLNYEVLNNLVVEMTRLSVDMKNHKMLVESVAGRLDFSERRARALESIVQNRVPAPSAPKGEGADTSTGTSRPRRRRRRSRRRPGGAASPEGPSNEVRTAPSGIEDEKPADSQERSAPVPRVADETPAAPDVTDTAPGVTEPTDSHERSAPVPRVADETPAAPDVTDTAPDPTKPPDSAATIDDDKQ